MKKDLSICIYVLICTVIVFIPIYSCEEKDPIVVTGNIEGTITNRETDELIQGVIVSLVANGNSTFVEQSKATGADAKFSFKDLEAGSYKLSFEKEGYEPNTRNITIKAGETSSSDVLLTPIKPELNVSLSELNYGTDETSLTFTITNNGKGELKWEVKEDIEWLEVNPASGTTTTETSSVTVKISRDKMEPGNYDRTISVTTNGGNKEINVKVIIEGPILEVSPLNLDFGSEDTKKTLLLKNIGDRNLDYSITSEASWVSSINPSSGNITDETDPVEISVNRNGLNYGNYSAVLHIISTGSSIDIDVQMVVPDPNKPQLTISNSILNFGTDQSSMSFTISNSGNGNLEWSLEDNQTWINVNSNSGTLTSDGTKDIIVTVNREGLVPNNYFGKIDITSNGGSQTCNIEMEILAEPVLNVAPIVLDFGHTETVLPFVIKNLGTGNLNWDITKNKNWISLSENEGTNQSSINVSVDRSSVDYGVYSGEVNVTSNGGYESVVINMEKRAPNTAPELDFTVSPSSGFLETSFALNITCSDDYTATNDLLLRWKWQEGGNFTNWSTSKSDSHSYSSAGTKSITVEVKDEDEAITILTKSVEVSSNENPVASFTVTPQSGTINTEFAVDASNSSDDFTSKENLQIRWQWEDNAGFSNWTTNKTASHTYSSASNKTITLEVKDETGLSGFTTQNVSILDSEIEPNNEKSEAQIINLNSTITGSIVSGDNSDFYTFTSSENGNFYFSFKNLGAYNFSGNCYFYLDGYDGGWSINYIERISGISSMTKENSATIPICKGFKYYIRIDRAYSVSTSYELSTVFIPESISDNNEPNDDENQATTISINSSNTGLIGYSYDFEDFFQFTPLNDGSFSFSVKNLHPVGISQGSIGNCSISKYGDVNSLTNISSIAVANTKSSNTIQIKKDMKYIIKIKKNGDFESAPYLLTTTFR